MIIRFKFNTIVFKMLEIKDAFLFVLMYSHTGCPEIQTHRFAKSVSMV